ncbi:hypothetical protein [Marinomonas algicola]|uniref:hypothetical protein n=1 Tax=Marinomonas algicola TaxID=2773454 RepID=UPI00174B228C|nr:hypothetical protein [Marinomonas algicola]
MNKTVLATLIAASVTLTGCNEAEKLVDGNDDISKTANPTAATVESPIVRFNPAIGALSTPNDILLEDGTIDPTTIGRLSRIPNQSSADVYSSTAQLDGWGISTPFTIAIELPDQAKTLSSLDSDSVAQSNTVLLFECPTGTRFATGSCAANPSAIKQLVHGTDFTTSASTSGIVVTPLKALKSNTNYFYLVTNQAKDNFGQAITRSSTFNTLSETPVESLGENAALGTLIQGLNSTGAFLSQIDTASITYSATFTTQSVEPVAQAVMDKIVSDNGVLTNLVNTGLTARQILAANFGVSLADNSQAAFVADNTLVYQADLDLPYFLPYPGVSIPGLNTCPTGITLCGNWKNSAGQAVWKGGAEPVEPTQAVGQPNVVKVQITVPSAALIATLNAQNPSAPITEIPIVQFVHGITAIKETVFPIAPSFASQGMITIAIDQPLHGSRSANTDADTEYEVTATSPNYGSQYQNGSAAVFGNLASLLTARDNLRQAASDQLALKYAISKSDLSTLSQATGLTVNASKTSLLGVSLGSIIGTMTQGMSEIYNGSGSTPLTGSDNPFLYTASAMTVNGAQTAAIMGYSPDFGPMVKNTLTQTNSFAASIASAVGYTPTEVIAFRDSSDPVANDTFNQIVNLSYNTFIAAFVNGAQTVVDGGDSIAWAAKTTATPTLVTQVVGNGVNLSDQTIPNELVSQGFPLAGTKGVIDSLNLTKISGTTASATGQRVYTNFLVGKHTSILSNTASASEQSTLGLTSEAAARATSEMQSQVISFLKSEGRLVQSATSDPSSTVQ